MSPTRQNREAEPETTHDELIESAGGPPCPEADEGRWRRVIRHAAAAARAGNQECVPF